MHNENKISIILDSLSAYNANKPEQKCSSLSVNNESIILGSFSEFNIIKHKIISEDLSVFNVGKP